MRLRDMLARDLGGAVRRGREAGALPSGPLPDLRLEAPKDPELGDLSCNLALAWSKAAGRPPLELARALVDHLPPSPHLREVRIDGPGFLNLFLSDAGLREVVGDILRRGPGCARSDAGEGREVLVPPSPEGPLTLALGRQATALDAWARLLEATGHRVRRGGDPGRTPPPVRLVGGEPRTFQDLLDELGAPVVRFLMLERDGPLDFDLALAADPTLANPAHCVRYACARVAGLLRMGADQGYALPEEADHLDLEAPWTSAERALVRDLEELPWTFRVAARRAEPHLVADWALTLARRFHAYYNHEQILGEAIRARLALSRAVRLGLTAACEALGVDAPERM